MAVKYDKTTDYQAEINKAVSKGDYASAKTLEQQRNAKIVGEGLKDYSMSTNFQNYSAAPVTPKKVSYMSGADMASNLGLDYNYQNILNKLNAATKDEYAAKDKEFAQTENKYYDTLYGAQGTALDTIRKSQAQAIATGASRGLQMSNELSSILGLQQESVANATQLAQDRNLLKDKETAAYTQNVNDATTTYNNLGTTMGTLINNKYAADVENNVGLMSYYAALDQNAKNLEGSKYSADQNLTGNKYTADKNLAGTQYSADKSYAGQIGSANIYGQAQRDAASINAAATKYAANVNAEVQKAYYASQAATSPADVFGLLNNAKSEDEYVAVLVRQGITEELAQQFWKNKNVKAANEALNNTISEKFYQQAGPSMPASANPALGGSGTASGYQSNQFGDWLYRHGFIDARTQ